MLALVVIEVIDTLPQPELTELRPNMPPNRSGRHNRGKVTLDSTDRRPCTRLPGAGPRIAWRLAGPRSRRNRKAGERRSKLPCSIYLR